YRVRRRRPHRIERTMIVSMLVVVALFLGGMLILGPIEKQRARLRDPSDTRGQLISKSILAIVDRVHQSRLAPALEKFNPFTVVPGLNKVKEIQQSVAVLSDPQEIENLIHHPSVEALQKRPETRQAVDQLLSDPEIRQVLQSDQPLDARTIKRLMDHPAVLELLDQPGFVEAAYRVIQQSPINL
ncbi:MAG: hypothetical protein MI861_20965, partial [Pirellulales bacterium]|nr:hypothetical protein [Pirellulales bacterium]